jgi:hypothetical protein
MHTLVETAHPTRTRTRTLRAWHSGTSISASRITRTIDHRSAAPNEAPIIKVVLGFGIEQRNGSLTAQPSLSVGTPHPCLYTDARILQIKSSICPGHRTGPPPAALHRARSTCRRWLRRRERRRHLDAREAPSAKGHMHAHLGQLFLVPLSLLHQPRTIVPPQKLLGGCGVRVGVVVRKPVGNVRVSMPHAGTHGS